MNTNPKHEADMATQYLTASKRAQTELYDELKHEEVIVPLPQVSE